MSRDGQQKKIGKESAVENGVQRDEVSGALNQMIDRLIKRRISFEILFQMVKGKTAETVFDNTLTDDKATVQKAIKAMGAFIHNGALSDGMMKDFAYQILNSIKEKICLE